MGRVLIKKNNYYLDVELKINDRSLFNYLWFVHQQASFALPAADEGWSVSMHQVCGVYTVRVHYMLTRLGQRGEMTGSSGRVVRVERSDGSVGVEDERSATCSHCYQTK